MAKITHVALCVTASDAWRADWMWGLPLIVLTVIIHVVCLGLINRRVARISERIKQSRYPMMVFVTSTGTATLLAICLHSLEAIIWAVAYRILDALPDRKSAILYSLSSITSYGHANLVLEAHWQLMGALEALNGWLLFGLTTAFLFALVSQEWSIGIERRR